MTVNPRERIKAAMSFQKTDRIPRYEIFLDGFTAQLKEKKIIREDQTAYDHYSKVDIQYIWADQDGPVYPKSIIEKRDGDAFYERDTWGRLLLKKDNAFFDKEIGSWIDDKSKVFEIEPRPSFLDQKFISYNDYFKDIDSSRFAPVSGVLGLYMGCSRLRGEVQFLMDMAEDLPFCKCLVERLAGYTKYLGLKMAEITETKDTAIWFYDELSSGRGPIFSPDTFEKLFVPYYRDIFSYWKSNGIKNIILHCDGNSLPLLDLAVEAGFTGIQSLAPTSGMWLPDVKRKYGNKLVLIGGMCNILTLAKGTYKEIEYETRAIVEAAKDGGVIIGTHSIDSDIPLENYEAYYGILEKCDMEWK